MSCYLFETICKPQCQGRLLPHASKVVTTSLLKVPPELTLVDLCNIFRAGAVKVFGQKRPNIEDPGGSVMVVGINRRGEPQIEFDNYQHIFAPEGLAGVDVEVHRLQNRVHSLQFPRRGHSKE